MLRLKNQKLPNNLATMASLRNAIYSGVAFRQTAHMDVSGYPVSSHVVHRIQERIKLASYEELLKSLVHLRNLARLASDVLGTIPIARIDRQQMNRSELVAYVAIVAESHGMTSISPEDQQFVAYMITSSESTLSSWTLQFATDSKNRFLELCKLYKSAAVAPTLKITNSEAVVEGNGLGYIYDPDTEEIKSILSMVQQRDSVNKWRKAKSEDAKRAIESGLNSAVTIHTLASIRVIDHISLLLNSTDAWDMFVSARKTTDPAMNEERARTLRVFAGYLQSILMYPHIFALEMFKQSYDTVQATFMQFPPLSGTLMAQYDMAIHQHDVFDAEGDVKALLAVYGNKHAIDGQNITVIPEEVVSIFGVRDAISKAITAATAASTPIKLAGFDALGNAEYNPYMLAHPVAELDLFFDLSQTLYMGDLMKTLIKGAVQSVLPATTFYLSEEVLAAVKRGNFRVPFAFCQQLYVSTTMDGTSSPSMEGHRFAYRHSLPRHSYDYRHHMRREAINTIFKMSKYTSKNSEYLPQFGINYTHAQRLRSIVGADWRSLYPTSVLPGDFVYTKELILSNEEIKRRLMETISGEQYAIIERRIANPYIAEQWATFLSSFALLYVAKTDDAIKGSFKEGSKNITTNLDAYLVRGYGHPYGTTYDGLASKQGNINPDDLIKIADGVYIVLLKKIPTPTHELKATDDFYLRHDYYYFASNSETIDVKEWVMDEGMLHFSLFPLPMVEEIPQVFFTKKHVYLADEIYAQLNLLYSLPEAKDGTASITYPLTEKEWRHDKLMKWVRYVSVGTYGPISRDVVGSDKSTVTQLIEQSEKAILEAEKTATTNINNKPQPNVLSTIPVADLTEEKEGVKTSKSPKKEKETTKTGETKEDLLGAGVKDEKKEKDDKKDKK